MLLFKIEFLFNIVDNLITLFVCKLDCFYTDTIFACFLDGNIVCFSVFFNNVANLRFNWSAVLCFVKVELKSGTACEVDTEVEAFNEKKYNAYNYEYWRNYKVFFC